MENTAHLSARDVAVSFGRLLLIEPSCNGLQMGRTSSLPDVSQISHKPVLFLYFVYNLKCIYQILEKSLPFCPSMVILCNGLQSWCVDPRPCGGYERSFTKHRLQNPKYGLPKLFTHSMDRFSSQNQVGASLDFFTLI